MILTLNKREIWNQIIRKERERDRGRERERGGQRKMGKRNLCFLPSIQVQPNKIKSSIKRG